MASFESRRAEAVAQMIEKHGGRPLCAPTLREVRIEALTPELRAFYDALKAGEVDLVVLMTGVGTRMLHELYQEHLGADDLPKLLDRCTVVARGPKPTAVLRGWKLKPNIEVPEPNTWRELLDEVKATGELTGKRIAVQEYGMSRVELLDGLAEAGATVTRVPIYRWALPEDIEPIRAAITKIVAGEVDYALFFSATQVYHLMQVADEMGQREALVEAFGRVCVGSVGPVTSEAIIANGFQADYEPDAPHMPQLVGELARRGADLLQKKRIAAANGVNTNRWRRIDMDWSAEGVRAAGYTATTIDDSVFMKACRREPTPHVPVWLMRQAGRFQREYRELRSGYTMVEFCRASEVAAEVTLMAADRLGTDAAIIFQDILLPLESMGFDLDYVKGYGPKIANPLRERGDLERVKPGSAADMAYVDEAVRLTRKALRPDVALIGFVGAPFTVASYAIEGGKSRDFKHTKSLMLRDGEAWERFMGVLSDLLAGCLVSQVDAGADAVQVFDSWGGVLSPDRYEAFVLPYTKKIVDAVHAHRAGVPVIAFATGNPALVPLLKETGADVVGLDWRSDLREAIEQLGDDVAVQGNLDPTALYATPGQLRREVEALLAKVGDRPGYIFNLGHGISPDMDPVRVAELVDLVHELSARGETAWA